MADRKQVAEAAVAEGDKEVARIRNDYHERVKGKPTPTQHECDLIKAGAAPDQKEADGAGPEVKYGLRQVEASPGSGGSYQTRAARPAPNPRPAE